MRNTTICIGIVVALDVEVGGGLLYFFARRRRRVRVTAIAGSERV